MEKKIERLGVDIGGVIIEGGHDDNQDTSFFSNNYLRTPAAEGAFNALRLLNTGRFKGEVYLVSKCGDKIQAKTRDWLYNRGFTKLTGIPESHFNFCVTRDGKAPICQSLGITHFVDDRLEILSYMPFLEGRYLYRPNAKEVAKFRQHIHEVKRVDAWSELLALLQK